MTVSSGKGLKVNSLKGGNYAVYGGNGHNGYHSEYLTEEPKLIIGRVGVKCGVMHITKPKSWVTDNALIVEPKNDAFDIRFLKLKLGYENLNKLSVSTAQPVISGSKIYAYEILLPPKEIQLSIVSKIEELFSELDKGIENLRIAQQQLKTYRQSVLKWGFEGRLTNEDVKEGKMPDGWKQVQIKEIAATYGGYAFKSVEFKSDGKYQVLRMGNVKPGILRYDESPVYIDKVEVNVLSRSLLQLNDVIITQTGTRKKRDYGFTALIPKSNLLLNQRLAAIRFGDSYLPKFFLYFSWTDIFKDQFFSNETGNVGQGNVGMKAVTETLIPFCTIEEQFNCC